MRIITLEEHMTTPLFLKSTAHLERGNPTAAYMEALREKLLDCGAGRIADMDANGIDMQVLSLVGHGLDKLDAEVATHLARATNDTLAAWVKANPTRFAAFATLNLQAPEKAAEEFERCVGTLGFKGALLNGTTRGLFLDDPRFTPVFEVAQQMDVPIYLHPAPPPEAVKQAYYAGGLPADVAYMLSTAGWGWHVETGMHCLRLIVAGVFDRFPKLKMIIGHMGEDLPYSIARADAVLSRATPHLERRVGEYFHEHFWVTNSGYFTEPPLRCALDVVGIDRMMFSVDYPFSPNQVGRKFLDSLTLSDEDMSKFTHRNAEKLLKIGAAVAV
jgi:predicted TIM-barrel fold metal-dependent hydrolase